MITTLTTKAGLGIALAIASGNPPAVVGDETLASEAAFQEFRSVNRGWTEVSVVWFIESTKERLGLGLTIHSPDQTPSPSSANQSRDVSERPWLYERWHPG